MNTVIDMRYVSPKRIRGRGGDYGSGEPNDRKPPEKEWELEEYRQAGSQLRHANRQIHYSFYLFCFVLLGLSQIFLTSFNRGRTVQLLVVLVAAALYFILTLNSYAEVVSRDKTKQIQQDLEKERSLEVYSRLESQMDTPAAENRREKFLFWARQFTIVHVMAGLSILWLTVAVWLVYQSVTPL